MIIRLFRVTVRNGMSADFERDFSRISKSFIAGLPGVQAVHIAKPTDLSDPQYMMISLWDSYAAIEAALGAHWAEAHIPAGMEKYISACTIEHLEQI